MTEERNCSTCGNAEPNDWCSQQNCWKPTYMKWKPISHAEPMSGKSEIKTILEGIQDGGTRTSFGTGAIREGQQNKGRYDLIPQVAVDRLAKWYEKGAMKYAPRNWEQGIPTSNCMNSLLRHAFKASAGWTDEDHLSAIAWNAMAIMFMEVYHPELCDIPNQEITSAKEE